MLSLTLNRKNLEPGPQNFHGPRVLALKQMIEMLPFPLPATQLTTVTPE